MRLIIENIKWFMLISGLITCSMLLATIAPTAGLMNTFGSTVEMVPLTEIVVRNWGALIGLIGAMLVYGAFHPSVRGLVLVVACVSKTIFIGLILTFGMEYLDKAIVPIMFDSIVIAVFLLYLFNVDRQPQ